MNVERYEASDRWFKKHSKSDFTKYVKINSKINWAYWIVAKYSHLTETRRTKEADKFIEKHRIEIVQKIHSAEIDIEEWHKAPSDIKKLLFATSESTRLFISHSIEVSDSINFHNKIGIVKEEPLDDLLDTIDREQHLMRLYAQHTDEVDLNAMYYKWAYAYYETIKHMTTIGGFDSWIAYRRFCMKSLRGSLPTRAQIISSAAETIGHLNSNDDIKDELTQKFTNLWLHLFVSSAQYNRSLRLLISSPDYPSEEDLREYEAAMEKAAARQFDSCILLANLFLNKEIYSS